MFRRPRMSTLVEVLAVAVALAVAGLVAYTLHSVNVSNARMDAANQRLQKQQGAQATVIGKLSTGLDTTRRQLQAHGVKPSAPPAKTIVQQVPGAVMGPPGAAGPSGTPGSAGSPGPSGSPGASGAPGTGGAAGRSGPSGVAGNPGPAGVQGPVGPAGPTGAAGAAGDPGAQGPKGDTGATGPAGPAPSGWTFTYTDATGTATTYDCAPDSAGSTHYTCTPQSSPTPTGISLGMAAAMSTAAYRRRLGWPWP